MTALIVAVVVLFAVFALFIAWWDLRGWLHDVELEVDADDLPVDHDLAHNPRRINREAS